jgi:peptidoglycan biosynthesis protein MviN/MurJ (putative lipid II flippase)
MRSFYFAQVIYFTNASYLELVVAVLYLGVSTALSLALVPLYGPRGAAIAMMVACVFACLAFMVLGRRWYLMPIDMSALIVMPALAALSVFAAHEIARLVSDHTLVLALDAAIFAVCGGFAIRHFGLLHLPSADVVAEGAAVR